MRFSELELLKYGHLEGCHLRFPAGDPDLHVVFGPNEAGKSTMMSAVSDLLFGFPHITPYDFRFDQQLLRVGATLHADGKSFACRRKKGRKGTLVDADETALDDGALAGLLGGYAADGFHRMFSLDHERLREGGSAILKAEDDVGQAIFAAGSGLVGVAKILDDLEAEAKEIWTKRAGNRTYYLAQKAFEDARSRQRAAQIRPAAWDDLRKKISGLNDQLEALRVRRRELDLEREEIERQRRVLPHAALFADIQAKLSPLLPVPNFPNDAPNVLDEVAVAVAAAETEAKLAEEERVRIAAALEGISVDDRLLRCRAEIDALRETKGGVDKSLLDLPRRRADLAAGADRLRGLLRELEWHDEPPDAVGQRLPQRVRLAEVRGLLEDRSGIDATVVAAEAAGSAAQAGLNRLNEELHALPPARELDALLSALKHARNLGDIEAAVALADQEIRRREGDVAGAIAQLIPWTGQIDQLRSLPLPEEADASEAAASVQQAAARLAETRRDEQTERDRKAQLELNREQLVRDSNAVTLETVRAARDDRDLLWREIRQHVLGEASLPDPSSSSEQFEREIVAADDLADRRFDAAAQSARLTGIEQDLERSDLLLSQHARAIAASLAHSDSIAAAWTERLMPAGLELDPQSFGGWMERRRRALAAADEADQARATLEAAGQRRDEGRARLADALAAAGRNHGKEQPFTALLEAAEGVALDEQAAEQKRRELTASLKAAKEADEAAGRTQADARERLAKWQELWDKAVPAIGLNANQSHAVVRAQLELLDQLRSDVEEVLSLEQRIAAMEEDVENFGAAVRATADSCGIAGGGRPPADLLSDLAVAGGEAQIAMTRRTALEQQLADASSRIVEVEAQHARALGRLAPLFDIAGTKDRTELQAAVARSDTARSLRHELERIGAEILNAAGGSTVETLLASVANADSSALTNRSCALQDDLVALTDDIARLTGELATAKAEFGRLDAGPDAAIAAADAEQARAEMAAQAEAYLRKRAETALLRWAINRYRSSKQAPLLIRSSALFSKLTLGRYTRLLVDQDGDRSRLAGVTVDEDVVPVEGMSDGTVDQLFLALRLAAVEDAVAGGARLPFLADDLFINYDDERAQAGFEVLAELARKTQVLFFTHHKHLVSVAERSLAPLTISVCELAETGTRRRGVALQALRPVAPRKPARAG